MGKVVFNIVETDYDVSKDEEKYQKFRKDYLENLSVGVCRLQEQYGLTSYRREKFINRIKLPRLSLAGMRIILVM